MQLLIYRFLIRIYQWEGWAHWFELRSSWWQIQMHHLISIPSPLIVWGVLRCSFRLALRNSCPQQWTFLVQWSSIIDSLFVLLEVCFISVTILRIWLIVRLWCCLAFMFLPLTFHFWIRIIVIFLDFSWFWIRILPWYWCRLPHRWHSSHFLSPKWWFYPWFELRLKKRFLVLCFSITRWIGWILQSFFRGMLLHRILLFPLQVIL